MNAQNPLTPQAELELRLDALERDARAAARHTYIGSSINFAAAPRPELIARLDKHAGFWNTVLGALQTSSIVALGRIYDQRKDVLSARKLVTHASAHRAMFTRASLAERVAHRFPSEAEVQEFVALAHEPTQVDFDLLNGQLATHTDLYETTIQPIRHNVFAHAGHITRNEMLAMFANVPMADLERLTVFPLQLWRALWQCYHNGYRPEFTAIPISLAEITGDPVGEHEVSWEHRHAVKDTTDFLAWLENPH
jgi:hypothetical protein